MKKLIFTSFICMMALFATAQIKLLDLSIVPAVSTDSSSVTNPILNVRFKIKNAAEAEKIIVWFGTQANENDILIAESSISQNGTEVLITYNGLSIPIINYSAEIKIPLTVSQNSEYHYITLYAKKADGTESNRLSFGK